MLVQNSQLHLGEMHFFVLLDLVHMIFTDSYIGAVHLKTLLSKCTRHLLHKCSLSNLVQLHT